MGMLLVPLCLLLALSPTAFAGKDGSVTNAFKFKEDFYLKFCRLPTATGPDESAEALQAALDDFARDFKRVWTREIEASLQGGDACMVVAMKRPKFTICEWKYPDRYDVDELPIAGQCYKHKNCFVQRIYYEIEELEITCPKGFGYRDLEKNDYTREAFSDNAFLDILNPPDSNCDGDEKTECLFDNVEYVDYVTGYDACTAELFINRFLDVPIYLKCLKKGFGTKTANKIINALDLYFMEVVSGLLTEAILDQTPTSFVYSYASPYESVRRFGAHGSYFAQGNLVDQVVTAAGAIVTKFTYGFDVIWFKDRDFDEELLPDVEEVINEAFMDGQFLDFLRNEFPDYDFLEGIDECGGIDPGEMTFSPTEEPTTEAPTKEMTLLPTMAPVEEPMTLLPTEVPTENPTCPGCIIHPDDKGGDECPFVTRGTCGNGKRGDGICPYAGHCCSKYGWCGTTREHCDSEPAPAPYPGAPRAPTYCIDAGTCGRGDGDKGDGFCPDKSHCCSDWGYCGEGPSYCFLRRIEIGEDEDSDGTCGGGGVGNGSCGDELCCSKFGFCGKGDLYCTGKNGLEESDGDEDEEIIKNSPLPTNLKPKFGFRCGFTEADARSNCKRECTHHVQCSDGEECWGIQLNYCHTFIEGEHPLCKRYKSADNDSRCGYDEVSARGHCGRKCDENDDCGRGQFCFPTMLNLCKCHEREFPKESAVQFAKAREVIAPFFLEGENEVEGKPRSGSVEKTWSTVGVSILAVVMLMR